jgi:hypothetical protein
VRRLEAVTPARLVARFRSRLRRAFRGRGALRQRRAGVGLTVPISTLPVAAAVTISTIASITGAKAALIATERPIVAIVAIAVVPVVALVPSLRLMLGHRRRLETVVEHVLALVVAELIADVAGHALAVAVGVFARLTQLVAVSHDDARVVLGVLKVVFRQHRIAGRLRITSESKILLRNVRRRAPDFYIRPIGFETAP